MRQSRLLASLLATTALAGCGPSTGEPASNPSAVHARGPVKPPKATRAALPPARTTPPAPSTGEPGAPGTQGETAKAAPSDAPKPGILFGVYPSDSPTEMYRQFLPLCEYLTNETGYPVELYVAPSYETGLDMIRKGKVDLFRSGAGAFGRLLIQENDRAPVLVAVEAEGEKKETRFRGAIITRQDSPIRSLQDLAGKNFAFGDRRSTMGALMPRKMLKEKGITLGNFEHLKSHDDVALAVLNQGFDAGACKAPTAEKYREKGLRILEYTPDSPSKPIYARRGLEAARIEAVRKALLSLDVAKKEHAEILRAIEAKLAGYAPGEPEAFVQFARFLGDESDEPTPSPAPAK